MANSVVLLFVSPASIILSVIADVAIMGFLFILTLGMCSFWLRRTRVGWLIYQAP